MNGCDHVIGMIYDYDNTRLVTLDDLKQHIADEKSSYEHFYRTRYFTLSQYADRRVSTDMTRFEYCPLCGKKIDWVAIKRSDTE